MLLDEKTKNDLLEKGLAIKNKVGGTILKTLTSEIEAQGVPAAIRYCTVNAMPITDSLSKIENVKISRVSHRYRNPDNKADSVELALIGNYTTLLSKGENLNDQIVIRNDHPVYYSPMVIQSPTCLKCHGLPETEIDTQTLTALNELYPEDRARNFKMGDLRGLFKVEFARLSR